MGTMPPIGVKLSWEASTDPVLVPVVAVLYWADWIGPKRTSLPSMLPPDCVPLETWLTSVALYAGLPACSCWAVRAAPPMRMMAMAAKRAKPCLRLPTHLPKVIASPKGRQRQRTISSALVRPVGFSKGWAELALKKPPPLVPRSLIASMAATGPWASVWPTPERVVMEV